MTEPTVVSFSASSSLIFMLNSFSRAMKVSSTSRESRPRSLEKEAEFTRADSSTPNFSWKMVLILDDMVSFLLITLLIINFFKVCHRQDQSGGTVILLMQIYKLYNGCRCLLLFLPRTILSFTIN